MNQSNSEDYSKQFNQLQKQFVLSLPVRLQELENASNQQTQKMILHRLVGAAGSYGFDYLSQIAYQAENCESIDDYHLLLEQIKKEINCIIGNN